MDCIHIKYLVKHDIDRFFSEGTFTYEFDCRIKTEFSFKALISKSGFWNSFQGREIEVYRYD